MSLGLKVYAALANNSGVAALVSTRIHPAILPQTPTYPAISYLRVSNTGQQGSTKLRETRYQINCWGATYAAAQSLAVAVKTAFEEYVEAATTPRIEMTLVVNELDDYDDQADIFRVIVDVLMTTSGD
jgi:hypothetical protein